LPGSLLKHPLQPLLARTPTHPDSVATRLAHCFAAQEAPSVPGVTKLQNGSNRRQSVKEEDSDGEQALGVIQ